MAEEEVSEGKKVGLDEHLAGGKSNQQLLESKHDLENVRGLRPWNVKRHHGTRKDQRTGIRGALVA